MPWGRDAFRTMSSKYYETIIVKSFMIVDWQGPNCANVGVNNDVVTLPLKEQRWNHFKSIYSYQGVWCGSKLLQWGSVSKTDLLLKVWPSISLLNCKVFFLDKFLTFPAKII